MQNLSKFAMHDLSKFAMHDLSKFAMHDLSKFAMHDLSKFAMHDLSKFAWIFGNITHYSLDKRAIFMFLLVLNLLEKNKNLNTHNLYKYIKKLKYNNEWISYCQSIASKDCIFSLNSNSNYIDIKNRYFSKIITHFFRIEENGIDITHNKKVWYKATHLVRLKDKIEQFTGIKNNNFYEINLSNNFDFNFNKIILNKILYCFIKNIPKMKQYKDILESPIEKCYNSNNQYKIYIYQCISGKNSINCINYMKHKNFDKNIIKEVKHMSTCDIADILVKFGFKYNNKYFEFYEDWEKRILDILQIPAINPKLSLYIKLLIEKINPISKIKTLDHNIGISNYLYLYIRNLPNNKMLLKYINIYIETEDLYNTSYYILLKYLQLMKVFDNKKIFNNTNLSLYIKLHEKIYLKYLLQRKFLLEKLC
jgi:hypothetical protein